MNITFETFKERYVLQKETQGMAQQYAQWDAAGILTDTHVVDEAVIRTRNVQLSSFDEQELEQILEAARQIREDPMALRYTNVCFKSLEEGQSETFYIKPKQEYGIMNMAPILAFFAQMEAADKDMRRRGIPEDHRLYINGRLQASIKRYVDLNGFPGYQMVLFYWNRCFLKNSIFRLGELQFEMRTMPSGRGDSGIDDGAPIIAVHIPRGAKIDDASRLQSYREGLAFIKKYFPEFKPKAVYCCSWMLNPLLREILPETSKILAFQSDFRVFPSPSSSGTEVFGFVFPGEYPDYQSLPETTSLQRAVKQIYLDGGVLHVYGGVLDLERLGLSL